MNILKGKLTYLMAFIAILWGVTGYLLNWTDGETALKTIWIGLVGFGLRRAIK